MNKEYRYDPTIKVGDYVTCDIRKGIHKVTEIKKGIYPMVLILLLRKIT